MAELKTEAIQPDPAATSVSNGQAVKNEGGDSSVPASIEGTETVTKIEEKNGAKPTENGDKTHRGGKRQYDNSRGRKFNGGNRRNESKYDPSTMPADKDPQKIRAQVEFYFGDSNLPKDKHMWELVDGSSNNAVSIKEIHRFGRMKNYQPYEAVVSALRESTFFEVSGEEGAETIQRKRPYDPQFVKDKETRQKHTVYAKGFGDEKPSSQFDIEAFFANYGATNEVRLRRDEAKFFKSSVFVEFTDAADAEKFVTLEPKPTFEGNELKIMSKSAYEEEKIQLIRDGKMEPNTTRLTSFYGPRASRGRGRGDGFKGGRERRDRDPNDWKKRREDDQASGFKNDRRGGGRGGRRGGRDGRDDKGPQDRNQEREFKKEITTEASSEADSGKKRARENDGGDETVAKKQDTKEGPAETS